MARCASCGVPLVNEAAYCTACGMPRTPSSEPVLRPPRPSPRSILFPVLAAVVGVVVLVAAAAYLTPPNRVTAPANLILELQGPWFNGSSAVVTVSYAYPATSPEAFLVSLSANGSTSMAVAMPTASGSGAGVVVTPAGYPFLIAWTDMDHDGKVSPYDTFAITPTGSPPPCCLYETFYILRQADGSLVAQVSFYGGAAPGVMPGVSLGPVTRGSATNVYIAVSAVSSATSVSNLRFKLVIGYNVSGTSQVLPFGTASNVSVGGGEYLVAWYDTNSNGWFDAGDAFNVSLVAGAWPISGTLMVFELDWQDGSVLTEATWTA